MIIEFIKCERCLRNLVKEDDKLCKRCKNIIEYDKR